MVDAMRPTALQHVFLALDLDLIAGDGVAGLAVRGDQRDDRRAVRPPTRCLRSSRRRARRSHASRATACVSGSPGPRPIIWSVCRIRSSDTMSRNGDWPRCTVRAWRSVPSKSGSLVPLAMLPISTRVALDGSEPDANHHQAPPPASSSSSAAAADPIGSQRRRLGGGASGRPSSIRRRARRRSASMSIGALVAVFGRFLERHVQDRLERRRATGCVRSPAAACRTRSPRQSATACRPGTRARRWPSRRATAPIEKMSLR